ncbi:DoxX family membrane protein [Longispora albida]|uniref:DoxX family membrane protein n=1 Tax=Longispora albida TaxID=203523 RepID=UPI0003723E51|nr:DoxX family membrane protein [Longispora albida]
MTAISHPPAATWSRTETASRAGAARYVFALLRLGTGWIFLWAFLDKMFGLGYATKPAAAWIEGGHPTQGFLKNSAKGPLADFYHSIAGTAWADALFMAGLAGIGVALILGIGMRVAATAGALLLVMMWTVVLPPATNPVIDDHLISAGLLIGLALTSAGDTLGLGRWWARTRLVRRMPWLR